MLGLFAVSCQKKEESPILEEQQLTEEELIAQLNSDPVALNYVNALEAGRDIIREVVAKNNLTSDEFRDIYDKNDKSQLDKLFQNTTILETSSDMERARQLFVTKYPDLDSQISIGGCRRFSRGWWKSRACAAACVGGGSACSFLTAGWGTVVCAVGGYACIQACYAYFC